MDALEDGGEGEERERHGEENHRTLELSTTGFVQWRGVKSTVFLGK